MHRFLLAPLGVLVMLLAFYLSTDRTSQAPQSARQQEITAGDGDTTDETLNTLIATVNALDDRLNGIRRIVQDLQTSKPAPIQPAVPEQVQHTLDELFDRYELLAREMKDIQQYKQIVPVLPSTPTIPVGSTPAPKNVPAPPPVLASYTIPAGTILFDAVALTALVGKIPVEGALESPFPVMVLVGDENIVPGGKQIAAIKGMMLSGTAVGDKTLRCVNVHLNAAHFVFEDGTIASTQHLASSTDNRLNASTRLGWLSDLLGIPCLPGELIKVSRDSAFTNILRDAAKGYALARQENEIQEVVSADGNVLRALVGDAQDFNRAAALSSVFSGTDASHLGQEPSEAIFVPSGKKVIAHINKQLELDYLPTGRQIVSGRNTDNKRTYVYPH